MQKNKNKSKLLLFFFFVFLGIGLFFFSYSQEKVSYSSLEKGLDTEIEVEVKQDNGNLSTNFVDETPSEEILDSDLESLFFISELEDSFYLDITKGVIIEKDTVTKEDLRLLNLTYVGFDGEAHRGELIVNKRIAEKTLTVFQTLYEAEYPIEKIILINHYNGDDIASMEANNTSGFNYRNIAGSNQLSNHSYGLAIDLNPLYNPYVKEKEDKTLFVSPETGTDYADRTLSFAHKIDHQDLAYQLFTEAGFTWGGDYSLVKDYQHFEYTKLD